MKKYELLKNDTIKIGVKTLYRIRALKDFGNVKTGDIGGYVESENNLNQYDYAWVYENARVYGNAKVCEDANVFGDARVYGNTWVYGDARVYGNANVFGDARVYENAKVFGDAWVYGNTWVYGDAWVYENTWVYGDARVCGASKVCGETKIETYKIIGKVTLRFKKIRQIQCRYRVLTAILTEDNEILYSIGCQNNITKQEFIDRIYNLDGGLKQNPHRQEYIDEIEMTEMIFKKYM